MVSSQLRKAFSFFFRCLDYADGYRAHCAFRLAKAEAWAARMGYVYAFELDTEPDISWLTSQEKYWVQMRLCPIKITMYDSSGNQTQSLSGIVDADEMRVISAELAYEELDNAYKRLVLV